MLFMTELLPEQIRAWGFYTILETQPLYQVKRHTVYPSKRNSYQRHQRRAEFWVVVQGVCHATINDVVREARAGEVIEVPLGAKHRWENKQDEDLVIIEIQTGNYFGEDDIERFEDDFGRAGKTTPN